jgi:hypothetical protein
MFAGLTEQRSPNARQAGRFRKVRSKRGMLNRKAVQKRIHLGPPSLRLFRLATDLAACEVVLNSHAIDVIGMKAFSDGP